jgi:septal ring factor EnvC (AmiA/AmiB activator)
MKQLLDENYPKMTHDILMSHLEFFSKVVRNMLRYLVSISAFDSATLLENFWKLIVKTLDAAITKYEKHIMSLNDSAKSKIKRVRHEMYAIIQQRDDTIERGKVRHKKEVKRLKEALNHITGDKLNLEQNLNDRDAEIKALTGHDARNEAVGKMTDLMKKLSRFFNETETEKNL